MSIPTIIVEQLNKTFGHRRVLDGISFNVTPGEMVALIGPSGSGKSTLLRHLVGLTCGNRGEGGRVSVMGRDVQMSGRMRRASRGERCRTGYIFQQFNLVGRLSVMTNVLIGGLGSMPRGRAVLGRFSAEERQRARECLARVGLEELAEQRANTLSGGQQQRVAIARVLMQDAEIILADEPIASLDPRSAREVMEILERIHQEDGRTVVVTLHQVEVARRYCKRAIALKEGRLYFDGPTHELTDGRLQTLYENAGLDELRASANTGDATEPARAPAMARVQVAHS
ncbi:phosphonate ABC transporter ATP-binding protein [Halomonas huangheensis]|uniref:ABC transporter n=1 Tax=Halomonas huangheensis TaxID=1178482 RepID=W1N228_9GAMM|nr:phosphonate ABC transporter ATP-binding protein [Halomonas huangheensis]ALM51203.1 phosphonate/organophosphate ester transporter subunit [Halomonas huangheensis]ERL49544.1 ABC transporter [Halomonas huangheensis]